MQFFSIPKLGEMARSYSISANPAKLEGDIDLTAYKASDGQNSHKGTEIVAPGGANVNVVDFEPGGTSVLHQTVSIDFSICTNGVLDHELDSGEIVRLYPGVSLW
jgi:quercetin dioxygenase-like cupin family protein